MQRGLEEFTQLAALGLVVGGKQVEMNFRARAAGAGVAHHPEVILLVAVDDVDGGIEAFLRKMPAQMS
jgi:hypothetical protein